MAVTASSRAAGRPPLLALKSAHLRYADKVIFDTLDISITAGERACLVGRNGGGKSTLMRVLAGEVDIDSGERFVQPGTKVAYLPQDPRLPPGRSVIEHVNAALPPADDRIPRDYLVAAILDRLSLPGERLLDNLSGGEARRVALARTLVTKPDVLLLDEPTNHLDLPTIEWLEDELRHFPGGLLLVSHDRTFLDNLTNRTFWIERGKVFRRNHGFSGFTDWADKILADEENQQHKLDKKIAEETRWLREGLTARRKRNEGRLGRLLELRQVKAERLRRPGLVNMDVGKADSGGSLVLEANDISHSFHDAEGREKIIVKNFSVTVKRGDRIGIIGRNGAGKTSLLKMLIGRDKPDRGRVRIGFGVESIYFDQKRESLNPDDTLWSTLCPGGGDTVFVRDKPRHVASYLRDFLFRDRQITAKVKTLSGGERNRLLMAKLFAANHNLLVLDEPTNDLDIETLDLLQDELARYDGTILLVSHDRDFIDRVVTSIIAVEGDGSVEEYAGGFNDYLRQRTPVAAASTNKPRKPKTNTAKQSRSEPRATKLSFNEQRDLEQLPGKIATYEQDIVKLQTLLADPAFFSRDPVNFERATRRLAETELAHSDAEERWLELEMRRQALSTSEDQ